MQLQKTKAILLSLVSICGTASLTLGCFISAARSTPIYTVQPNGDMLFYKHTGTDDGSNTWPVQAVKIGNGWNFKQVFAGENGAIYAIKENGDMLFYKHTGFEDGSPTWPIQAVKIGNGWNFKQVFAGNIE